MPIIAGVDVPNWCVAGAAVLTPAAVYAYLLRTGQQRQAYFADLPRPKETSAILGGLANMPELNDPLQSIPMMKQLFKTLGPTWGIRLPRWLFPKNELFFMTADPAIVAEIQSKKDVFHSRVSGFGFDNTIPLGLLALRSEGPQSQWALHRRLIAPLFSDKFLLGYSEQVQEKVGMLKYILNERIKATKGAEAECDIQECLKLVTLDVIGSIGFGFNSKSLMTSLPEGHPQSLSKAEAEKELEFLDATEVLMYETQQRTGEPWIFQYSPLRFIRWQKAKGVMRKRIHDVLTCGKQEGSTLNMLKALQNAHEGDKKMSKAELTDEILSLLLAGHETTGYTTSWALFEVAKDPDVQEKIMAEASAVDLDTLPLTNVQSLLPYTWMAWQEALRFHPTVPFFPRQAEVDTVLGGKYKVPAGSIVSVNQMTLAHSEEIWGPDVMSFSPERMEKGYPEMHLPFGYGGRTCIGKRLAYVEGVYLLAFIVKNFKLRVGEESPAPTPRVTVTHHAADGINLLLSKRYVKDTTCPAVMLEFAGRWASKKSFLNLFGKEPQKLHAILVSERACPGAIAGVHVPGSRRSAVPTPTGEFFTAEFKTFNEANGWGFVGCEELRARFGADVFAHNRELINVPNKAVGEVIYFELGMTEDGKPQVLNAQPAGPVSSEPAAKKPRLEESPATANSVASVASAAEAVAEEETLPPVVEETVPVEVEVTMTDAGAETVPLPAEAETQPGAS